MSSPVLTSKKDFAFTNFKLGVKTTKVRETEGENEKRKVLSFSGTWLPTPVFWPHTDMAVTENS